MPDRMSHRASAVRGLADAGTAAIRLEERGVPIYSVSFAVTSSTPTPLPLT